MSKTLLLADDSVTIQRVVELTFAHQDVRIVAVGDGERAMHWLGTDRPDLVLVDVAIPEVDGYTIAKHIKKTKRLKDVPVLLMAGAFETVDEEKARKIGCDGIVVKPFEPQHLVERVMELLGGSEASSSSGPEAAVADAPRAAAGPQPVASNRRTGPTVGDLARESAARATEAVEAASVEPEVEPVVLELPRQAPWAKAVEPKASVPAPPPEPAVSAQPAGAAARPKTSLVNAFTALLAAEQTGSALTSSSPQAANLSDDALEVAVRRVLDRMTGDQVRQIVLETAERLIREEIEKIKADPE